MTTMKKCGDRILFNSGKNLVVYNEGIIKTVDLPKPIQKIEKQEGKNKKENADANIACFCITKDNKCIAVSSENKQVLILNENFELLKSFKVARVTSAMCFTSENCLIVADKTGDVFLYDLKNEELTPELLLGHYSVVLDVVMTDCEKYVVTCDRDEKIKVSRYPNAYNIESFCLGHEEFVIAVVFTQNKLISASGDGTVRFWDHITGKQLAMLNTNEYIDDQIIEQFKEEMNSQNTEVSALPITDLQCFSTESDLFIGVSLYQYDKLLLFSINPSSFMVNFSKQVYVGEPFSFHLSDDLLVLTKSQLRCLKLCNRNYKGETQTVLNIDESLKLDLKSSKNISLLYKKKFDNVEEYIERKKARLK